MLEFPSCNFRISCVTFSFCLCLEVRFDFQCELKHLVEGLSCWGVECGPVETQKMSLYTTNPVCGWVHKTQ
jgi:hypothetical protein